jgi:hypothetical protein
MINDQGLLAPDFAGIGPSRTGTTWLHEVLSARASLPRDFKETDFFGRNFGRGFQWYARQFRCYSYALPIGEFSPSYFIHPAAPRRLADANRRCRIICTLRDPVERAYSQYKLLRRAAWIRLSFEEAVERHRQIADENRYAFHLRRWTRRFGSDSVLVLFYDDLRADAQRFADAACDFIGVARVDLRATRIRPAAHNAIERAPKSPALARNARHLRTLLRENGMFFVVKWLERAGFWRFCFGRGEPYPPLEPALERLLRARYRAEVEALEDLLGRDLAAWKDGSANAVAERTHAAGELAARI